MAKKPFTFENNFDKVIAKVREKPYKVLNTLGSTLAKEIRTNIRSSGSSRRGLLSRSLGTWARKQEKDLQIGFKLSIGWKNPSTDPKIIGDMLTRKEQDPIYPVVLKNKDLIAKTIGEALDEIRRE